MPLHAVLKKEAAVSVRMMVSVAWSVPVAVVAEVAVPVAVAASPKETSS